MDNVNNILFGLTGNYKGYGVNHEKERFLGVMKISCSLENVGIGFNFTATGENGEIFHNEIALIGKGMGGKLKLVAGSNNTNMLLEYFLAESDEKNLVFQFGDTANVNEFRERRVFTFHSEKEIVYSFWWGLPSGDFQERSSVTMKKL